MRHPIVSIEGAPMPEAWNRRGGVAALVVMAAGALVLSGCVAGGDAGGVVVSAPDSAAGEASPTPATPAPTGGPRAAPSTPRSTPQPAPPPAPPVDDPSTPAAPSSPESPGGADDPGVPTPTPAPGPAPVPGPAPDPGPAPGPDPADSTSTDSVRLTSSIGSLDFDYTGQFDVSSGLDFTYTGADFDSPDLTITVEAGHDNTSGPATSFDEWTGGTMIHTDGSTGSEPSDLHYAFCGGLQFGDYGDASIPTCFGQGQDGLDDNWWLGGTSYSAVPTEQLCFTDAQATNSDAQGLAGCIYPDGDSSTFALSDGGVDSNWVSLYSPSASLAIEANPHTVGSDLLDAIENADPNLTAAQKAALRAVVAALPDKTVQIDTPTGFDFSCADDCAGASDFSVSSGELWAGVHASDQYQGDAWTTALDGRDVNNYSLNATAGREKSPEVADWFTDQVGAGGGLIGAGTQNGTADPSELNFAFCGNLQPTGGTFTAAGSELCIAQGSNSDDGGSNNWWFGGEDWTEIESIGLEPILEKIKSPLVREIAEVIAGDTEARVIVDLKHLTAVIALSGNAVTGVAVDNFVFVVGLG